MKKFIPAPNNPEEFEQWRTELEQWRSSYISINEYKSDYAEWVDGEFVEGLVMLWDRELWNEKDGYTVDAFLDRVEDTFGKWDHVVLWNNYPLSGLDDRNQIDYFEDLPGGLDALKAAVADFHRRGVRVMLDHKPWVPVPARLCRCRQSSLKSSDTATSMDFSSTAQTFTRRDSSS